MSNPAPHHHVARPSGFTIFHMIVVLALMGVFLVAASQLTMQCVQLWNALAAHESSINRLEQVMHRLQRDAWGAEAFEAATPYRLVLTQPNGEAVTWLSDADEPALSRIEHDAADGAADDAVDEAEAMHWRFTGREPVMFEVDRAGVRVVVGDASVTLVSQVRLAQGER